MFLLTVIEDKLKILPSQFGRNSLEVLKEQIEVKYSNRILLNVGLCITFYDFLNIGDPYLYPSEGSSIQLIKFRMIVFRPFVGEILFGTIVKSNKDGIYISMDFFDEIFIPSALLHTPNKYNEHNGLWTWIYGENKDDFVMEIGEQIRFKVRSISFTGLINSAKGVMATTTSEEIQQTSDNTSNVPPTIRRRSSSVGLHPDDERPSAMQIIGAMNDFGLGLITWW